MTWGELKDAINKVAEDDTEISCIDVWWPDDRTNLSISKVNGKLEVE